MAQLRLDFDAAPSPVLPPAVRSRTSIAAAQAIADMAGTVRERVYQFIRLCHWWPGRFQSAGTVRERVYQFIGDQGDRGATREEIAQGLQLRLATVCGRCNELVRLDLIYDSGTTRTTSSGRQATVLKRKGEVQGVNQCR